MGSRFLRRGVTLIELLVSISIIAVITSAIGLVYVPRARKAAAKVDAIARMRQVVVRINQFAADRDGQFPRYLETVSKGISIDYDSDNPGTFHYALSRRGTSVRHIEGFEPYGFEPGSDPVLYCLGLTNYNGATVPSLSKDKFGNPLVRRIPAPRPGEKVWVLGMRLDGSAGWFEFPAAWTKNIPLKTYPPDHVFPPDPDESW